MTRNRERQIIVLYTILGVLLAIIGFYLLWVTNTGILGGGVYLRYGLIGLGLFLLIIGSHLTIVGVNSLRGS